MPSNDKQTKLNMPFCLICKQFLDTSCVVRKECFHCFHLECIKDLKCCPYGCKQKSNFLFLRQLDENQLMFLSQSPEVRDMRLQRLRLLKTY